MKLEFLRVFVSPLSTKSLNAVAALRAIHQWLNGGTGLVSGVYFQQIVL